MLHAKAWMGDKVELAGQILIAMPGMADPRFERSVIVVCAHSGDGAMGLIINKPLEDISFSGLLEHLKIPLVPQGRDIRVHLGGPVERVRGFVLHSQDWRPRRSRRATLDVPGGYGMTATTDILEALAKGEGPDQALLALGYSGWGPGQLESEIARNDWLTTPAPKGLVFDGQDGTKWSAALRGMGIDPLSLSATSGRA
jgi:putative transcriptional regulator